MHPQNITRIYRSLLVYSLGFNRLLLQLAHSNSVRNSLWKVFSILVEYCSNGEFESVMAQVERDRISKVSQLTKELEHRQNLLEESSNSNEERNKQIYKELRQLKQENQELVADRALLLEEFKQAEQAFNNQVGLRLRYENKIN